jgi:hypothetical protein
MADVRIGAALAMRAEDVVAHRTTWLACDEYRQPHVSRNRHYKREQR